MWIVPLSSYLPPTTEEVNAIARDVYLSIFQRIDQLLSPIPIIVRMPDPDCFLS